MTKSNRSRKKYTELQDRELLDETGELCPLCGEPLVEKKNGRRLPVYDRAHIYPHSPTQKQENVLIGVPKPDDVEDVSNIVLLCLKCHHRYDSWTTREEYLTLYETKQVLVAKYRARQEAARVNLAPELKGILARLSTVKDADLEPLKLAYVPISVKRKIEEGALQRQVITNVSTYFNLLKHYFRELDDRRSLTFDKIAKQMGLAFIAQNDPFLIPDKNRIFAGLVDWVESKTGGSRVACEAVVSYFIQDCEVFREISK